MVNMDSSTTKVSKSVARKINHYLNKERVESEYDPSGKGIHTTNPLMANYELAYLVTTEDEKTKSLLGSDDKDQCSEGEMLVLPCLVPSAQCKSHVRRSDAKRVTSAAHQVISTIPVKEIDMIRRYRPSCRTADTLEMGKVSQMSRSVHAMLNTKQAVDFAVKRDKKTKKLRAKSAYQPRRLSHETSDGELSGKSDQRRRRTISSAKPKKLRQKYTELPFGPGNSSHIASWLSEQKEKEKKAIKKKEKQRKRAEKEAMIEKERRDKEEIVTAMGSLQTDDNDRNVKENSDMDEKGCSKNNNVDKSIERSVKRGKRRKENKNEGQSSDEIKRNDEKQERDEKQQTPDEKNDRNNNDSKTIKNSGQTDMSINDEDSVNSTAEQNMKVSRRFSDKTDSENDTNSPQSSNIVATKSRDSKTERSDREPERRDSKTERRDSKTESSDSELEKRESKMKKRDSKIERRESKTEKSDSEPEKRDSKTKRIRDSKIERRDSKTEKSDSEPERRESKTKRRDSKIDRRDSKTEKSDSEPERRESKTKRRDSKTERRDSDCKIEKRDRELERSRVCENRKSSIFAKIIN